MCIFNFISLYLVIILILTVFWAAYIKTLNGSSFTNAIMMLCFALCFYILGYALELNSCEPSQIVFWNHVEYVGIPFVSALWLTTALLYTGRYSKNKIVLSAAIYLIPVISLILRYTNDHHHLYFAFVGFAEEFGKLVLIKESGAWMYVQSVHSMLMILISMGLFIQDAARTGVKQRGKILLTIAASFFAIAGLLLTQIKPFGFTIDYMVLCLPVTASLIVIAIARFDLLETRSIARSRAFEFSGNAILLVNRQNKVIDYNISAKSLFERLQVHISNTDLATLLQGVPDLLEAMLRRDTNLIQLQLDGREHCYEIATRGIDERPLPRGWIKTVRDVTEIHRLNEELKKQAITDELSMLNNRRAFMQIGREWVDASEQSGGSLSLCMFDIDFFKQVNDHYGHPAGDSIIQDFGRLLKEHFSPDGLVARLGGEEFAVLQSGRSVEQVRQSLRAFLGMVRGHTFHYRNQQIHLTVSAGCTKKSRGQTLESLMRNADKALYESKAHGRDRITML
jgi:diguanylate cyclase (GGDEF)-like protein